jgi:hypothetical protein
MVSENPSKRLAKDTTTPALDQRALLELLALLNPVAPHAVGAAA